MKKTILVVEDSRLMRVFIVDALKKLDQEVLELATAKGIMDFLLGKKIDLIVLDLNLKDSPSGEETAMLINARYTDEHRIPIIIYSSMEQGLEDVGQRIGAVKAIHKKTQGAEVLANAVKLYLDAMSVPT